MATKRAPAEAGAGAGTGSPKKRGKKAASEEPAAAPVRAPAEPGGARAPDAGTEPALAAGAAHDGAAEGAAPAPTRDEVARRAYEIWLARGGSAFENWLEAERQLSRR